MTRLKTIDIDAVIKVIEHQAECCESYVQSADTLWKKGYHEGQANGLLSAILALTDAKDHKS